MNVSKTPLPDVLAVENKVFSDSRGNFAEAWNKKRFEDAGIATNFVQDNYSLSRRGVLRGMHFQSPFPQVKLVSVLRGGVFDVVVDLRRQSSTFRKWWGTELTEENGKQIYIPAGFAHGFLVTREDTIFLYKCSEFYHPEAEQSLLWNDPAIGIQWPIESPILSSKDAAAQTLSQWLQKPESKNF